MREQKFDFLTYADYRENPFQKEMSAVYGRAIRLLTRNLAWREKSLNAIAPRLWPAVRLGQIEFLFDSHGFACAFASWAYVTEDVIRLLRSDPAHVLDIADWNEGDQVWLVDFFAPFGNARNLWKKLRQGRLSDVSRIRAVRTYLKDRAPRHVDLRVRRESVATSNRGQASPG